jgi:pimeloyl-ACP methyl ester carboxylesterase
MAAPKLASREISANGVEFTVLEAGSRFSIVDDAGHFLHLEKPGLVNEAVLSWVYRDQ